MDKVIGTTIVLVLITTALVLMGLSWQRRQRRDLAYGMAVAATSSGVRIFSVDCWYVATTPRDNPLERLAIAGLAYRAKATVSVESHAILIEPAGEHPTLIDSTVIDGIRAADATIDRSAGRGSLTALDWTAANGEHITSFLRIPGRLDRQLFADAARQILDLNGK